MSVVSVLLKPEANRAPTLPWANMDMDFMDLNHQAAHADRDHPVVATRPGRRYRTAVAHASDPAVQAGSVASARAAVSGTQAKHASSHSRRSPMRPRAWPCCICCRVHRHPLP